MPIIKPSCIRDMKLRINVVDVISRVASLKKVGARFKGLCPFHNERTPSFHVDADKGYYKCFGCGKSGDIFTFVRDTEHLSFTESVEALAERFNVPVEYEQGAGPTAEQRSLRQELFDIYDVATEHYHQVFKGKSPTGEAMRKLWLEKRHFTMEIAEEFKIGASGPTDEGLIPLLLRKGYSEEALRQCDLVFIRENSPLYPGAMRPRYRGRLMIPIRDHQGRVVAFTARQTDITPEEQSQSHLSKYINSRETPIFSKSHLLFNLDRARTEVDEKNPFVLVEGQLDAIRCWSVGLKTAVAPQGTSITDSQLTLMHRYCRQVECFFDSDNAGQKAALKFVSMALKANLEARFLRLEGAEKLDPDLLFLEKGLPAYDTVRQASLSSMGFACRAHMPEPRSASPEQKARAADALFEIVINAESEIVRSGFLSEIAEHLDLPPNALERDFHTYKQRHARMHSATQTAGAGGMQTATQTPGFGPRRQAPAAPRGIPTQEPAIYDEAPPEFEPSVSFEEMEGAPSPAPVTRPQVGQMPPATPTAARSMSNPAAAPAPAQAQDQKDSPESHMLLLLLHFEAMIPRLNSGIPRDWIDKSHLPGQLLARFLVEIEHDNWPGRDNLDHLIESSEERSLLASLLFDPPPLEDPIKVALEGLKRMKDRNIAPRLRKIELDLARLRADSAVDALSLIKERTELQRQLRQPIGLP